MQALEPVFFALVVAQDGSETRCEHVADKTGWRCVLQGQTTGHLICNIDRDRKICQPVWPIPGGINSLANISRGANSWPSEAHHLIPWQQLSKHPVKSFLKKGAKLLADANYSVNHGFNGKFMPFASDLAEWKGSEAVKAKVAFDVMDRVGIQLHQGKHSFGSFDGDVTVGYKSRVKELLDKIRHTENIHRAICPECAKKSSGEKLPPRMQITRKTDGVSGRLEKEIDKGMIFVSRRAHTWYFARKTKV